MDTPSIYFVSACENTASDSVRKLRNITINSCNLHVYVVRLRRAISVKENVLRLLNRRWYRKEKVFFKM